MKSYYVLKDGTMQMRTVGIRNRAKIGQWPGKTD